jgi:hypothetical protein
MEDPEHNWKPRKGVVGRFQKFDPGLTVWIEEFGASAWYKAVEAEKKRRGVQGILLRKLPPGGKGSGGFRPKGERIRLLQSFFRDGDIILPRRGFGHGTHFGPGHEPDNRDTLEQYLDDEYRVWVIPDHGKRDRQVDDMLDTEAWHVQPEVMKLMSFPAQQAGAGPGGLPWPANRWIGSQGETSFEDASWRVH